MGGLVHPRRRIEESMEGFAAGEGVVGVDGFLDLGEGVEERPCCPGFEFRVAGVSPFVEDVADLRGGDGPA